MTNIIISLGEYCCSLRTRCFMHQVLYTKKVQICNFMSFFYYVPSQKVRKTENARVICKRCTLGRSRSSLQRDGQKDVFLQPCKLAPCPPSPPLSSLFLNSKFQKKLFPPDLTDFFGLEMAKIWPFLSELEDECQ